MKRPCKTRGTSVLECVVALSVMAAMLTTLLSIQVVQSTRVQLAKQRLVAQQTLANLAARAMTAGYDELEAESIQTWLEQAESDLQLPAGTLSVEVVAIDQPAIGQRIEFLWDRGSPLSPRYRTSAWRFADSLFSSDSTTGETP